MVTVELQGRLGNVLFQLAATVGLATKYQSLYLLPEWKGSDHFEGPFPKVPIPILPKYNEPRFSYSEILNNGNLCLFGYFQSLRYFEHCEGEIRKMFTLRSPIRIAAQEFIDKYAEGRMPVSLHQRRGDYLTIQETHPVLPLDYYKQAVSHFDDSHHIFIMSDDMPWVKRHMASLHRNITFCGLSDIMDFAVGSLCSHHIISNSSFSWWQAYLGGNPDKKVFTPKNWFGPKGPQDTQDLIPNTWLRI